MRPRAKHQSSHRNQRPPSHRQETSRGGRDERAPQSQHRQVIGIHAAREVLKVRPTKIVEIWLKEGAERDHDLKVFVDFAVQRKVKCYPKPVGFLDKIAPSHQGVCLMVSETPDFDINSLPTREEATNEKTILIALDQITDPHNTGAIMRTAWLLGAQALIVPENRAGHLTPAATKVASGGAEHVPLVVVENLASALTDLKEKGFWIYGLAGEAKSLQWDTRFNEKVVLVVGAEDKGLRSTTANVCDELIAIPQVDNQASFNASVATALAIYEVARQHRVSKNP